MSLDQTPRPLTDDAATPSPGSAPVRRGVTPMRALLLRVHFWSGLLVGPFILVAALSGLLYTLTPTLEPLIHREVLTVPDRGTELPLSTQVAAGLAALPPGEPSSVRPAPTGTDTTRVTVPAPELGGASYHRTAFVDPHTAEVTGVLTTYGSGQALPLRTWVSQLHANLHLGDAGRLYAELAASWLWVLALGGLVLWAGMWRRRRTGPRRLVLPRTDGGRRARLLSWHGTVGLWAVVGMLFLAATGLTWSTWTGANITALRAALSWETPAPAASVTSAAAAPDGGEHPGGHAGHDGGHGGLGGAPGGTASGVAGGALGPQLDAALAAGREAGLRDPIEIVPAGEPGATTAVAEVDRTVAGAPAVVDPVTGLRSSVNLDAVAVDPATGAVVDTVRFDDWPVAAKLARWGVTMHMGLMFGVLNQAVLAALALGLACAVVWGSVLWWRRGPGRRGGTTPPRGAFLALSRPARLAVGSVAVLVALAMPVLGVSLLVFGVVDAVWSMLSSTLRTRRGSVARAGVSDGAPGGS